MRDGGNFQELDVFVTKIINYACVLDGGDEILLRTELLFFHWDG